MNQVNEWGIVVPNTPVIAGFTTREDALAFASEWAIKDVTIVPVFSPREAALLLAIFERDHSTDPGFDL